MTWRLLSHHISDADEFIVRNTLHRAFNEWSSASNLVFVEEREGDADLSISFERGFHNDSYPFDGPDGIVAHAFYPRDGRLHFDGDEEWTLNQAEGVNLFQTAVHEIGHLLGLEHSSDPRAAMYASKRPYSPFFTLSDDDVRAVRLLFPTVSSTSPPSPPLLSSTLSPPQSSLALSPPSPPPPSSTLSPSLSSLALSPPSPPPLSSILSPSLSSLALSPPSPPPLSSTLSPSLSSLALSIPSTSPNTLASSPSLFSRPMSSSPSTSSSLHTYFAPSFSRQPTQVISLLNDPFSSSFLTTSERERKDLYSARVRLSTSALSATPSSLWTYPGRFRSEREESVLPRRRKVRGRSSSLLTVSENGVVLPRSFFSQQASAILSLPPPLRV